MRLLLVFLCCLLCACSGATLTTHRVADDLTVHQVALSVSNVFIVDSDDGVLLIDAGDPRQETQILGAIDELGVDRSRFRAIVITHAHADHTGSAKALSEALGVPIIIQNHDAERAAIGRNPRMPAQNLTAVFLKWFLKKRWDAYEPQEPYERCVRLEPWGLDGTIRSAPGHTPGSSIIELAHGVVIVGDLMAGGFLGGALGKENPESHYFQEDAEQVRAIIRHLVESDAKVLFVGHGGPLEMARVKEELASGEFGRRDKPAWRPTDCDKVSNR